MNMYHGRKFSTDHKRSLMKQSSKITNILTYAVHFGAVDSLELSGIGIPHSLRYCCYNIAV